MDESLHLDTLTTTPLTVELVGTHDDDDDSKKTNSSSGRQVRVSIDKIVRDAETGNTRLVVTLPRLVDTAHAGGAVDLLLDKWNNYYLQTLVITGVRFTQGGINAIATFLTMQNVLPTIQTLVFHDIIGGRILRQDEDHVYALCKTFQKAPNLEILDLSHNLLGEYVWDALGAQTKLKSICLSDVEMRDSSFQKLQAIVFNCGETLQDVTISNYSRTGIEACEALEHLLSSCRNLRSFSWENKFQPADHHTNNNHNNNSQTSSPSRKPSREGLVPVLGLAQLSENMFKNDFGAMHHLELTGGTIPAADIATFCNALEGFHKLQTLKVSQCGLTSENIQRIVTALRSARPPLSSIDFSHNEIDCEGASWIAQLSCLRAVTKNLRHLNLEYNQIARKGALEVIERFASKSSDFHLRLQEGNPFDSSAVFLSLASSKHAAETELKDLHKDCFRLRADKTDAQNNLRELLQAQSTMVNDMHELTAKAKQLEEDKEGLIKAFSVLGMMQHVQERDNMLQRIAQLEEAVHGHAKANGLKNGHSKPQRQPSPTSRTEPTCLSKRKVSKARSMDDQLMSPTGRAKKPVAQPQPAAPKSPSNGFPVPPNLSASQTGRSPRSGRPTTARHQLVRAASERWNALKLESNTNNSNNNNNSGPGKPKFKKKPTPVRSKSSKSLAEFLNKSAPDVFDNNINFDDSFNLLDDSAHTTPAVTQQLMSESSSALGDARRRMRQQGLSSARSLPPRGESKSLGHNNSALAMNSSFGNNSNNSSLPKLDRMIDASTSDSSDSLAYPKR
ncbi:expressed unknown protein [Seminavis robusta]|uniref:Uncharacterized protein n=1 Tax=Seminavis robusta TaxID=568900 RepID=A0A9N8DDX5_9STRA|nr:expressed unknown protein [Seminavis robusta]|eukprot:Sro110_g054800.1 n/a (789) ;mRNA; r:25669-28035